MKKQSISQRIMRSMIFTLITVALITIIFTSFTLRTLLYQSTRRELKEQGTNIAGFILKQSPIATELENPVLLRRYVRGVDAFTEADIYILNSSGKVMYQTSESLTFSELKELREKNRLLNRGLILNTTEIKDAKGESLGKVILVQDDKTIERILITTRKAIWIAIIGSSFLGIIIALVLQNSISKPLRNLTKSVVEQRELLRTQKEVGIDSSKGLPRNCDEVDLIQKEFDALMNEKREKDEELKDFFQNSSHELKTPLMSIQGYAEAIRDGVMEGDDVNEALEVIINKSVQLKRTVEGILYLSKLEHAKIVYEKQNVAIVQVIEEWFHHYREALGGSPISLVFEKSNVVNTDVDKESAYIDPNEFIKVLEILLDNALRYAKSLVTISVTKDRKESSWHICVWDDGPGISEEELGKIFHRFYSGNNGKSGLGLAIAKKMIRDQGGEISASNHESGGAIFEIVLPCSIR